ncbi:hypothetical protein BJX96DRAFT_105859 [Aspergillus floccosus]
MTLSSQYYVHAPFLYSAPSFHLLYTFFTLSKPSTNGTMDKNYLDGQASADPTRASQESQVPMEPTEGLIYTPQYRFQNLAQTPLLPGNVSRMCPQMQTIHSLVRPDGSGWNHPYPLERPGIPNYGMPLLAHGHGQDMFHGHFIPLDGSPDPVIPRNDYPQPTRNRPTTGAQERSDTGLFRCQWKDCAYSGSFGRRTELRRHVETQHLAPSAYRCSERGCGRLFNRRDNLDEHLRRVHSWRV